MVVVSQVTPPGKTELGFGTHFVVAVVVWAETPTKGLRTAASTSIDRIIRPPVKKSLNVGTF